ncbi:MAG: hypothetical protein LBF05_01290 [Tannerella sp.]|jgi:hypothetical protein|nr:hypothetical protein [Tannerella sp.]
MRKLGKFRVEEMENQFPVLTMEERRQTIGGINILGMSDFERACLYHYIGNTGDTINLGSSTFMGIASAAANCGSVTSSSWVDIGGNMYHKRTVNMYGCDDYDRALGTCTIYYDMCGNAVGMKDYYDFNMDDATRSEQAQRDTRFGSLIPGSAYRIYYGIHD